MAAIDRTAAAGAPALITEIINSDDQIRAMARSRRDRTPVDDGPWGRAGDGPPSPVRSTIPTDSRRRQRCRRRSGANAAALSVGRGGSHWADFQTRLSADPIPSLRGRQRGAEGRAAWLAADELGPPARQADRPERPRRRRPNSPRSWTASGSMGTQFDGPPRPPDRSGFLFRCGGSVRPCWTMVSATLKSSGGAGPKLFPASRLTTRHYTAEHDHAANLYHGKNHDPAATSIPRNPSSSPCKERTTESMPAAALTRMLAGASASTAGASDPEAGLPLSEPYPTICLLGGASAQCGNVDWRQPQFSGFRFPRTVGISSETVGWMGTAHCRTG